MSWVKSRWIFTPSNKKSWLASHGSVPFALNLATSGVRVFFSPREANNRSIIAWLDFDPEDKQAPIQMSDTPLLESGMPGTFNDRGSMMSWALERSDEHWFYYIGWNVPSEVPSHPSIGMIRVRDALGKNPVVIENPTQGPVLDRGPEIPYFASNPCVLEEDGCFRMWYLHGLGWRTLADKSLTPSYQIGHAVSADGIHWHVDRKDCLTFSLPSEIAIARPSVRRLSNGDYEMWYCFRGLEFPYRLGYAYSKDGIHWTRLDHLAELSTADSEKPSILDLDDEMQCYPFPFEYGGSEYLLYCGNGYGRYGFGLACSTYPNPEK